MADQDDSKAPGMMRIDDDDVEGHAFKSMKIDADEDEDVEGHAFKSMKIDADEDDDVEGHFGTLKSPSSRGE